ncbi:hypothetical protein M501DRAFT_937368 [Patellaria atrata CBS 101060]|uniref:PH domain-containing protein n=1 Tax=Patellaria atrata CBS 101060 TaxID=1346257 RepID=A0A9P4VLK8_9PEZI|nr:hypothetical protein M501DRAFT_937368 [Patellaria atrata CBS 101060]
MTTRPIPTRTSTTATDDDAVPGEDTSEVTRLFQERLQAWKHAVVYLEDYIGATEKVHHAHGKEYEKVLKTVSHPLKEGTHFSQSLGGVAGMFDNIRSNTQGISNSHSDTAKVLKGSVLPVFERLHAEIKNKNKELTKGAGKGAKLVDKARNSTQKQIELFGQHTATFDSTGGRIRAEDDPYVLQRGVLHRLNKQVIEENNNRQDLLAVQDGFAQFEAHVLQTVQTGMGQFMQVVNGQAEQSKAMYSDMVGTIQRIPPDFEWKGFLSRNTHILIDPNVPQRTVSSIQFPNQNHRSTKPLIAGSLEKKGKLLKRYETAYYVVTPSKYLHEFKTDDDFGKEPTPEISLYLPDCVVGGIDGQKFNVKGKDVSKGSVGNKFSMSHEFAFKAHTPSDAQAWWETLRSAAGQVTNELPEASTVNSPVSPVDQKEKMPALQTENLPQQTQTQGVTSAGTTAPTTAGTSKSSIQSPQTASTASTSAGTGVASPTTGIEKQPGQS